MICCLKILLQMEIFQAKISTNLKSLYEVIYQQKGVCLYLFNEVKNKEFLRCGSFFNIPVYLIRNYKLFKNMNTLMNRNNFY